jgi:hypothetical protein
MVAEVVSMTLCWTATRVDIERKFVMSEGLPIGQPGREVRTLFGRPAGPRGFLYS